MIEHDYDDCGELWPDRVAKRPIKFGDLEDWERRRKLKPRERAFLVPAVNATPWELPQPEVVVLMREVGLAPRLFSQKSVEVLGAHFRNSVERYQLEESALRKWQDAELDNDGDEIAKQGSIISHVRGQIFEEVITREFCQKYPEYFLTNHTLTLNILMPVLADQEPGRFSMPDHLVFLKTSEESILVGFMEDKKFISSLSRQRVFDQIQRQRLLWRELSTDNGLKIKFEGEVIRNVPSITKRVRIGSYDDGAIWLSIASDVPMDRWRLPPWVIIFNSNVSNQVIDDLAESLIFKLFLPRLIRKRENGD